MLPFSEHQTAIKAEVFDLAFSIGTVKADLENVILTFHDKRRKTPSAFSPPGKFSRNVDYSAQEL
jgi:hypothetical protein